MKRRDELLGLEALGQRRMTRRRLQQLAVALPMPIALAVVGNKVAGIAVAQSEDATETAGTSGTTGTAPILAPTPSCVDDDDLDVTLEQTEGPFYTPETPERVSLVDANTQGSPLNVSGHVYGIDCRPIAGALLDFWHADDNGQYDNLGFDFRGHQFADEGGRFALETIVPGLYSGRTRHIHVKVQAPNQPVLTTQLYFPDEPDNARDGIFDPALVIDLQGAEEGNVGFFNFVLDVA